MSRVRAVLFLAAIAAAGPGCADDTRATLRLASTTTLRDSGLLARVLPGFERRHDCRVEVLTAGTGAALRFGANGDVDIVLCHAREAEEAFVAAGHATERVPLFASAFILVGPERDPAGARGLRPTEALARIRARGARFVSRGDGSGTHIREQALWEEAGGRPSGEPYVESGRGMGATLIMADHMEAYTLSDRPTYLQFSRKIALVPLVEDDAALANPYAALLVAPARRPDGDHELARRFTEYMLSAPTQRAIGEFEIEGRRPFTAANE